MSDNVSLSTFPSNKISALTMLYLQNQNLSNATPEEIVDKYNEAYLKIRTRFSNPTQKSEIRY